MKIRYKLTGWMILISLVPIILLTYQGVDLTRHRVEEKMAILNEANANVIFTEIEAMLNTSMAGIKQLARNPIVQTMDPKQIKPLLTEALRLYPDISLFAVDNAHGQQIVRSNDGPLGDVRKRYFYIEAMQGNTEVISEVIASQADGRLIIVISTPVILQGQTIGVVQASLDLKQIQIFVAKYGKADIMAYVIGRDGKLLAHPDYQFIRFEDRIVLRENQYFTNFYGEKSRSKKILNFENEPVLLSTIYHPRTGWIICSETPYQKVIKAARRQWLSILGIALLVLTGVVLISNKVAGFIADPICLLQKNAEVIATGELSSEVVRVRSRDEIGALAVSLQKMVDYLFQYAYYDTLTGLKNRPYFRNALEKILERSEQDHSMGAVVFLDIDNFKTINDLFGHSVGDQMLREVSRRLISLYPQSMIARVGADEFCLLFEAVNDRNQISEKAQRLIEAIHKPMEWNSQELLLTASLGVAVYPDDGTTVEELLKNVDTAMYYAKKVGKNTYRYYTEQLTKENLENFNLEKDLKKAVQNGEFINYYQPQFDTQTKKLVGFEALVRWNSPKYGILPPGKFIDISERTGMISDIGEIVFRNACRFAKRVNQLSTEPINVSVNVSVIQMMQSDFVEKVKEIVAEQEVDSKLMGLEITETTVIEYFDTYNLKMKQLKEAGFNISLDDFGTGYSSLNYLCQIPVATVKLDKTFIDDIGEDEKYYKIIRAIVNIAHELDLNVVAEGVETEVQYQLLREIRCDVIQGYLLGRPIPEIEAENMVPHKSVY